MIGAFQTTAPLIVATSISKEYKKRHQSTKALKELSLAINAGEFIAITGESGSGKSTLLQIIGGLDKPTTGSIVIDGVDMLKLSDAKLSRFRNRTIGFVFQFFYLQPFLRVRYNVELPGMFAHTNRKQRVARSRELLAQVGLSDRDLHYPSELSGGQIQRAAIARALINEPKIILADEPTGNLDSARSQEIIALLRSICTTYGTTIIVVTHDPAVAAQADRVIRLHDGSVA